MATDSSSFEEIPPRAIYPRSTSRGGDRGGALHYTYTMVPPKFRKEGWFGFLGAGVSGDLRSHRSVALDFRFLFPSRHQPREGIESEKVRS